MTNLSSITYSQRSNMFHALFLFLIICDEPFECFLLTGVGVKSIPFIISSPQPKDPSAARKQYVVYKVT